MKRIASLLVVGLFVCTASVSQIEPDANTEFIILDYHTFLGNGASSIDFSLKEFADQLDLLAASGFRFVRLEDALSGHIEGKNNVVITIDDGHRTVYDAFFKVLKPRGITPFLFIYPAIVENRVRYALSPEQLKALVKAGCGVGAHGYNHSSLSENSWKKDYVQFYREIKLPGPALEKLTGIRPDLYAYPFGVRSDRAAELLPDYGYSRIFTADEAIHPISPNDPELDPLALPRTIMYRGYSSMVLNSMIKRLAVSNINSSATHKD
jgi:peptidoglycan/xylan/chitin deacetylase (PgdA/CDA1 family)